MSFQQPWLLLGLLLVPLLLGGYLVAQRRRRRYALRFTDLPLLASVAGRGPGLRRHLPPAVFLLGVGGLLLGLAGPVLNLEVARSDASVMLVIDVSGSMAATDVQPTRLDAARTAARQLIDKLPGNDRIGLISFSGSATLNAPLTQDRSSVSSALDVLQPAGATAVGDALALAVRQLAAKPTPASGTRRAAAMIVLLTDGASNRGIDPLTAAGQAKTAGIPVMTIGIGVRNGTVIVRGQDVGGVDEQTLQAIATATGGKYFYAEESSRLNQIYNALGSQFGWRFLRLDITLPVLLLGLLAVLVAAGISLVWFRVLP